MSPPGSRLGFWSAISTVVLAALHFTFGFLTPPRSGPLANPADIIPYPYTNVSQFIPGDYIWLIPGILLAPVFIVLMACIHGYAPEGKKTFSQIGLSFALVYGTVMITNYFIQFAVVVPSLQAGETAGLSLFTQYNPHGVFIALESLGYLIMSAALVSAAVVFTGGRLERLARWLFTTSFLGAAVSLAIFTVAGYDIVAFEVTVLSINWIVLIVSGILLTRLWRPAP